MKYHSTMKTEAGQLAHLRREPGEKDWEIVSIEQFRGDLANLSHGHEFAENLGWGSRRFSSEMEACEFIKSRTGWGPWHPSA